MRRVVLCSLARSLSILPVLLLPLAAADPPDPPVPAPVSRADAATDPADPTGDGDGWIRLFNGRDLAGWTVKINGHPLGENFADTFRVEDGVIKVAYDGYATFDDRFGHLFHDNPHSHYLLRFEYRFLGEQVKGGAGWAWRNSGIMLHGQDPQSMRLDQEFPVSIEVQLLGGDGEHARATANLCTPGTHVVFDGKLETRHCTDSSSPTFHGDRWVSVEIEVAGNEYIRHKVDGKVVLEYQQPQLDEGDGDARSWLERRGGERLLDRGSISLQSESHPCEFRNIWLKPLPGS